MDGGRSRIAAALTAASLCVLGVAATAQAATITAYPPAYAKPGTGPFAWTFAPSLAGTPVAWKLSSETAWHRCTTDSAATFATLPEGRYSLSVVDDAAATDALSGVGSVVWNPGDGARPVSSATRASLTRSYAVGTFTGSVTVTDLAGNAATQPFTVNTLPPPDLTPPTFGVKRIAPGVLAGRNLRVTLAVSEPATVSVAATIRAAGRTHRLPAMRRALLAGRAVPVRIAVKRDVRRAIAASLRRHRPVRATVTLVATDRAGHRSATTVTTGRILG